LPSERSESAARLDPNRYDSLRGEATLDPQPFIADPVVGGPYLKLFVPYIPRRHNAAMARSCPEALPNVNADGEAALACLARLQPLTLDGKAITVPWLATRDPKSGQRGMVVMIAVAGLAEGRHELSLMPVPRAEASTAPVKAIRIPFWK
jgi:hypothetical protein